MYKVVNANKKPSVFNMYCLYSHVDKIGKNRHEALNVSIA